MKMPEIDGFFVASVVFKDVGVNNLAKYFFEDPVDVMLKLREAGLQNVVLETCNRVEVYCYGGDPLRVLSSLDLNQPFVEVARRYRGWDVFRHLIHVVSGLDSLALGEQQIMGQVRKVFNEAKEIGCVGSELEFLFSEAFKIGKRVRSKIIFEVFDYAHAVRDIIEKDAGGKEILIVGTGKMANDILNLLKSGQGLNWKICVAGRSKLDSIRFKYGVDTIHLSRLREYVGNFDVVITCVSSRESVINNSYKDLLKKGVVIIDLGIPANVNIRPADGVKLYSFEDVSRYIKNRYLEGSVNIDILYGYVEEELERIKERFNWAWLDDVGRIIYTKAEEVRKSELDEAYRELLKIIADEDTRRRVYKLIDVVTWSLIKKIYHHHIEVFKKLGEKMGGGREILSLLARCFGDGGSDAYEDRGPRE